MCRHCGERKRRLEQGRFRLWGCPCQDNAIATEDQARAALDAAYRQAQAERLLGDTGFRLIETFRWDTLDLDRPAFDAAALHAVQQWFDAALAYGPQADYHSETSPPTALYLHSPGKGRGKTHVAAGAFHQARAAHKLSVFVSEDQYLRRRWGCEFEEVTKLVDLPGDRAWLAVLDDVGQRAVSRGSETIANAWYEVVNARWLKRGWTIITSNWTLEELWDRGTFNDATYSRLRQMTRGQVVTFHGADQRLV